MESVFSYGTLQLGQVQMELFGRTVDPEPDALAGFEKEQIIIKDEMVEGPGGGEVHVALRYTGNDAEVIEGAVLSLTLEELARCDQYETGAYTRIMVKLRSGRSSWVYVKNNKTCKHSL